MTLPNIFIIFNKAFLLKMEVIMKEKEFKIKLNPAILYFEIFYMVYVVYLFIIGQMVPAIVCAICGLLIIAYFSL